MDVSDRCEFCEETDCRNCPLGNPCLGCEDYDEDEDDCKVNGICGERKIFLQKNIT